ncbi:DUF2479 domain-containing protein [Staphylococcus saprophyticus]|uniref:BppU family phage baseplate upper protein n=1 Tax=Staphylococcus saprophyticus TaxID=29385 RepID=UPI00065A2B4A|nr:BppU family phage baseplate upper protein [Staphylococcus saprophyticus]RXS11752.1 DUF2479 domain-containing protein [Staphylococcus saprophyticus]CRV31562.1 Domain of uncharacterised function (DUF2479) [Streptococcus equi subsp. equi]
MANGIDKKALFKLKSEPYLKPISDLGVGFYNLDENTAILRFQLSNTKGPLLIHENNLTAYAYFESSNGSASDVIELEIEDSYNGVVSITLDKEFLQASTSTTVKGQVYIGVNNVDGNPKYNEVAVFREFKFEVADALINKISSFTKIEYIRMFDQLKMHIEQKVKDIEEAIANGADYVAEMKSVLQQGIETLNAIVADGKSDIQAYITQAKTDLTIVKNDATEDITTTANNAKTSVQDTASTAVNSINTKATETTEHVDSKVSEFNQTVLDNGFVTPEKLTTDLDDLSWQKYKLTNDDGTYKVIGMGGDLEAYRALEPGLYYTTTTPISGTNTTSTAGFTTVEGRGDYDNLKRITFRPYNSNQEFVMIYYNEWRDWEEVGQIVEDTGWVPFQLINGAQTNTSYDYGGSRNGYGCAYRVVTIGSLTMTTLRVNGNSVDHSQTIAQLPSNLTESPQVGYIRAPLAHNATSIIIENTGEVKIYINNENEWVNDTGHYFYGEISWINN